MRVTKYGLMVEEQRYTLVKESAVNYAADALTTAAQICQMFNDLYKLNQLAEEHVYMAAFTCKGKILGVFEVSHGRGCKEFCVYGNLDFPDKISICSFLLSIP